MRLGRLEILATLLLAAGITTMAIADTAEIARQQYHAEQWNPIHFKPDIEHATDEQCLGCHQQILKRRVLKQSPAGVKASESLAWYQTLSTYEGGQETFHRRHLLSKLAKKTMDLKCVTCHQGNDPREEAPPPNTTDAGFTLRKMVDPNTCLMCHGKFNYQLMGLPGPWPEVSKIFGDSCLTCHIAIRTNRHQVNFLRSENIEKAGKENADVCYGCHGGRAWYRTSYPYPRHSWPSMAKQVPEWAKDRATKSLPRFLPATTRKQGMEAR